MDSSITNGGRARKESWRISAPESKPSLPLLFDNMLRAQRPERSDTGKKIKGERRKPELSTLSACCTPDPFLTLPGQFQVERGGLWGATSTSMILAGWHPEVSAGECLGGGLGGPGTQTGHLLHLLPVSVSRLWLSVTP